ncbi:MAG: hypothetical protein ACE5GG_03360 [Candidatus Omnitrophota bacterium]
MTKGRFFVKLWLLLGFLAVGAIYLAKDNLRRDLRDFRAGIKIRGGNFARKIAPGRSAPFGVENKEVALKVKFDPLFKKFSDDDWRQIWRIIYGLYPEYDPDNERLPARKRQLDIAEMQEELKASFRTPFAYFRPEHWQEFWKTLKIRIKTED